MRTVIFSLRIADDDLARVVLAFSKLGQEVELKLKPVKGRPAADLTMLVTEHELLRVMEVFLDLDLNAMMKPGPVKRRRTKKRGAAGAPLSQ